MSHTSNTKKRRVRFWLAALLIGVGAMVAGAVWTLSGGLTGSERTFVTLTAQNNAVAVLRTVERLGAMTSEPDFTLSAEAEALDGRFAVALSVFDMATDTNDPSLTRARARLHDHLTPQTPLYLIDYQGDTPPEVALSFHLREPAESRDSLDVYGWDAESGRWRFLPFSLSADRQQVIARVASLPDGVALFRAEAPAPQVVARLDFNATLSDAVRDVATIVKPVGARPQMPAGDGQTLGGSLAAGFETRGGYRVLPVIRNYESERAVDVDTVTRLLNDATLRRDHIRHITTFANAGGYSGVFIDYAGLPNEQREAFSAFITELAAALRDSGGRLGVVVPAPQNVAGEWQTGAYDWREIGAAVDYLQFAVGDDPALFVAGDDRYVVAALRWAVSQVARHKLIVNLPARSVREVGGTFQRVDDEQALAELGALRLEGNRGAANIQPGETVRIRLDGADALTGFDTATGTSFVDYVNAQGDLTARVWLTTRGALRFRLAVLDAFGVGGVAFDDLTAPRLAAGLIDELSAYRAGEMGDTVAEGDADAVGDLRLRWRIIDAEGASQEFETGFGGEITVTLVAPVGGYQVDVAVVDGETVRQRESVAVAVAPPTATPTPLPRSTAIPRPTQTPTLIPVFPTDAPPPTGEPAGAPIGSTPLALFNQPAPPAPGGGSINMSGFEYGGHVTDMASTRAVNAMRSAGMQWMKVQVRFSPGGNLDNARRQIEAGRSNGFKTLIGLVGNPRDVSAGGEAYLRQFAEFAAGIARLGPDAIEVWNEPNIGREWPSGQISGANYTALLAQTYNAIKAANPNVMVISGAPAPTGAQDAFPGDVVNDDVFLQQMVNAGALNYMDCLGMHYNEGIMPPTATSGDPRDNYYTRYLPRLIERYNAITGGRRPICITELGYLSPQGFGPLPGAFGWAGGMDNARHASYLAGAISYASQVGNVRMVIVWNVDFTRYDNDPMAGYAIIRPDGSCPACGAIAGGR
ncbi:MAG: hypothetical protein EA396_10675 [Anaerolineaceae bacterium]|nr:MAG: hypothetical protein EA396_10675 [Anaerolineaceae bacterium]